MWVISLFTKRERERNNLTKFVIHWVYILHSFSLVKDLPKSKHIVMFHIKCVGANLYSFKSWAILYGLVRCPANEPFATIMLVASELWRSSQKIYSVRFSQTGLFGMQSSSPGETSQQPLSPTLSPMNIMSLRLVQLFLKV